MYWNGDSRGKLLLAIQVAAGIVLAYAIIVNQRALLRWGGQIVSTLAVLLCIGAIVWALVAAAQFIGASIPNAIVQDLLMVTSIGLLFILAMTAGLGLVMLFGLISRFGPKRAARYVVTTLGSGTASTRKSGHGKGGVGVFLGLALLAGVVNYALSFPVWAYTPFGSWDDALYAYGMTTNWKDGLSVLFSAILCQWPWIILGPYFVVKRARRGGQALVTHD